MKTFAGVLSSFVDWLRRPQRFIQKLQAIYPLYEGLPFHTQDEIATAHGVEIVETPFEPTVEAMTTRDDVYVTMAIRRGLSPLNRHFVIAHELGHYHLHLPELQTHSGQPAIVSKDYRDVEADAFAIVRLIGSLPEERLVRDAFLYVLANPDMVRRAFRVACYFSCYHFRIKLASMVERLLGKQLAKEAL